MASSKTKSNGGYGASMLSKNLQRSIKPHVSFCSSTLSSSSSANSSPISSFLSPNRITILRQHVSSPPTVRFSTNRRSITSSSGDHRSNGRKKTCMCSPTTHAGSFRCGLHRNVSNRTNENDNNNNNNNNNACTASYHSNRLYARRSAMVNSLVRIGTVEGDLVKRALAALIRPSSHQQTRRGGFEPRVSRLSVMTKVDD